MKVNDDLLLQMDTTDLIPLLYDSLLLTDRQRSHLLKFDEKIKAFERKCVERSNDENEDSSAEDSSSIENVDSSAEDSISDKAKLEKSKVKSLITFLRRYPQRETARNELLKALRSTKQSDLARKIELCKSRTQGNVRFIHAHSFNYLVK